MKKLILLLLAAAMVFSLAACGEKNASTTNDKSNSSVTNETYDKEFTILVGGKGEWTPFEGGTLVDFSNSDGIVLGIADNGIAVEFTGKSIGESTITATFNGEQRKALVRVRAVEGAKDTIPVNFISINDNGPSKRGTTQIWIELDPGDIGLTDKDVKITPEGAAGEYVVQYVGYDGETHDIAIHTPAEEITITVTLEKEGYTFTPASRQITIDPPNGEE